MSAESVFLPSHEQGPHDDDLFQISSLLYNAAAEYGQVKSSKGVTVYTLRSEYPIKLDSQNVEAAVRVTQDTTGKTSELLLKHDSLYETVLTIKDGKLINASDTITASLRDGLLKESTASILTNIIAANTDVKQSKKMDRQEKIRKVAKYVGASVGVLLLASGVVTVGKHIDFSGAGVAKEFDAHQYTIPGGNVAKQNIMIHPEYSDYLAHSETLSSIPNTSGGDVQVTDGLREIDLTASGKYGYNFATDDDNCVSTEVKGVKPSSEITLHAWTDAASTDVNYANYISVVFQPGSQEVIACIDKNKKPEIKPLDDKPIRVVYDLSESVATK